MTRFKTFEGAVSKLELEVKQLRSYKRGALEAANKDIQNLREKGLDCSRQIAGLVETLLECDAKNEERTALLNYEIDHLREPIMSEVTNLRSENRAMLREIDRTHVNYRHLIGDYKKF